MQIIHYLLLYIIMNPYTIPAPDPDGDTTFTTQDWNEHGRQPILILEHGWTAIGEEAFMDATELQMIRIPASVLDIRANAFKGTTNLHQVDFVEDSLLQFIREGAFDSAISLERIHIPAAVTHIGHGAFNGTMGLEQVTFEQGSQLVMFGFQAFYGAISLASIRIPASVTTIGHEAFRNASSLVEVVFEEGSKLDFIGDATFRDATALQSIRIPAGVADIGDGVFQNATSLERINIPSSVTHIGRHAFYNATSLGEVIFEPGSRLEIIREGAFMDATSLQTIQIPASVIDIRDLAFNNTPRLREITFEQNSQIGYIGINFTFSRSGLTKVVIGESALNRLNIDRQAHNLPPLRFGENNYFYGKSNVKIVSTSQQINTLAMIARKPEYKKRGLVGRFQETFLGKPKIITRKALPPELATEVGRYLMPAGVEPKSPAVLAARAVAATNATAGGARKSRTRKRGARRTQKRKPKRRRTMKHK